MSNYSNPAVIYAPETMFLEWLAYHLEGGEMKYEDYVKTCEVERRIAA